MTIVQKHYENNFSLKQPGGGLRGGQRAGDHLAERER